MKHELWKDGDEGVPQQIKDRNGAVAIHCCKNCGLAEIELTHNPSCQGYHAGGYEDRRVHTSFNINAKRLEATINKTVPEIMRAAADTYEERNKIYKDNYKRIGSMLEALFPEGVQLRTADDFARWQLFVLKVEKLSRLAISGLTHKDSAHDDIVYSAMLESTITEFIKPIGGIK